MISKHFYFLNMNFRFLSIQKLDFVLLAAASFSCSKIVEKVISEKHEDAAEKLTSFNEFPMIQLPEGYRIEKIAESLAYPTAITWDDQGQMYIAEARGVF